MPPSLRARSACLLAAALAVLGALAAGCARETTPRHAVLLIVDSLRADALDPERTPNLEALVQRGQPAEVAWSASTWTIPSVLSLFTGCQVREHGWNHRSDDVAARAKSLPALAPLPTLAEVLREQGFDTAGIFGNPVLGIDIGFRRGFDRWTFLSDDEIPARVAEEVATWDDGRRHFLYVHLLGPHEPLPPPSQLPRGTRNLPKEGLTAEWANAGAKRAEPKRARRLYQAAYAEAVERSDARVGEVLEALDPQLERTVLVLTSDHGEMLGEDGRFGHGSALVETLTRVPFVAVGVGPVPARINGAAVPDLLTRALGVSHDWKVKAAPDAVLVSERRRLLALSPDGRLKGVWRGTRLHTFDVSGYPEEVKGSASRGAELEALRARYLAAVARGDAATPVAAGPEGRSDGEAGLVE